MEESEESKLIAIDLDIWDNMLKDLDLPEDELMVAECMRMFLPNILDLKEEFEKAVTIEDDTVCVNRLELMMLIDEALDYVIGNLMEDTEANREREEENELLADKLSEIDSYEMVKRVCFRVDGGAFAEFLGRVHDAIVVVGEDELNE